MTKVNPKVVVAMSGGVDSSVSAILLKRQGFDVIGVTMKLLARSSCCNIEDVQHAREVCRRLGIEHYTIDLSKEFKKSVSDYFTAELMKARTPNPCVRCNRVLKFNELLKFAKKVGADHVATGHYARIKFNKKSGEYELLKGKDKTKDQSYYLALLPQKWLSKIIFPVGKFIKSEIYKIAKKEGLDFLVNKKESQDLCFVPDMIRGRNGEIVDNTGRILGKHAGMHLYTIGQRKGLFINNGPWFVCGFDVKKNQVIVTKDENDPALFGKIIRLKNVNNISRGKVSMAKIRYQQKLSKASLVGNKLVFARPQKAVTKGQVAVFYNGEKCLGGGFIC